LEAAEAEWRRTDRTHLCHPTMAAKIEAFKLNLNPKKEKQTQ